MIRRQAFASRPFPALAILLLAAALPPACGGGGRGGASPATAGAPTVEIGLANAFVDPATGNTVGDPTGAATVSFDVEIPAGTTASFAVEYSADGGTSWHTATIAEDLTGIAAPPAGASAAQVPLQATWQIAADLGPGDFGAANAGVGYPAIDVRVRVLGGSASPPAADPVEVNLLGVPIPSAQTGGVPRSAHVTALLPGGNLLLAGGAGEPGELDDVEVAWRPEEIEQFEFVPRSPLSEARRFATATVLADTRVLVAGGERDGAARATVDLYDPVAESTAAVAPLQVARSRHAAVLLADGRVLVAGGSTLSAEGTAEVYDPAGDEWQLFALAGSYGEPAAARLTDGRVLVVGAPIGLEEPLAELLTLQGDGTLATAAVGPPLAPRRGATATALPDGRVLLVGGRTASGGLSDPAAELFDPAGAFSTVSAGNPGVPGFTFQGRYGHGAAALGDGRVIVTGGRGASGAILPQTEFFLPLLDVFTPTSPLPEARADHVVNVLAGSVIAVTGGEVDDGGDEAPADSTATLVPPGGLNFEPGASSLALADLAGGAARISFRLSDPEGDDARVRVEWSATPADPASWRSITPTAGADLFGLATSAAGVDHEVEWDAAADGVFPGGAPTAEPTIRLTPIGALEGPSVEASALLTSS